MESEELFQDKDAIAAGQPCHAEELPSATDTPDTPKDELAQPEEPKPQSPLVLELTTKDLARALKAVSAMTPRGRKPSLPILEHVYLKLQDKSDVLLQVRRCDLEAAAQVMITVHLASELPSGLLAVCVSTSALSGALKGSKARTVRLILSAKEAHIETEYGRLQLPTMDADDFPAWIDKESHAALPSERQLGINLSSGEFTELAAVSYCAAERETARPVFQGISMRAEGRVIEACAADSFRLCVNQVAPAHAAPNPEFQTLVPAWFLDALAPLLPRNREVRVTLFEANPHYDGFQRNIFYVESEDIIAYTETVGGQYPNFHAVIPTTHLLSVRVDRQPFLGALKVAQPLCKDSAYIVKLHVGRTADPQENTWALTVSATADGRTFDREFLLSQGSITVGKGSEEDQMPNSVEQLFNINYLIEAADEAKGDSIVLCFADGGQPLRVLDSAQESWCTVIMPMGKEERVKP